MKVGPIYFLCVCVRARARVDQLFLSVRWTTAPVIQSIDMETTVIIALVLKVKA